MAIIRRKFLIVGIVTMMIPIAIAIVFVMYFWYDLKELGIYKLKIVDGDGGYSKGTIEIRFNGFEYQGFSQGWKSVITMKKSSKCKIVLNDKAFKEIAQRCNYVHGNEINEVSNNNYMNGDISIEMAAILKDSSLVVDFHLYKLYGWLTLTEYSSKVLQYNILSEN